MDALHDLEEQVLLDALADPTPSVIGAAGCTVEAERCRLALRHRAFVVWLELAEDELLRRMATGDHRRRTDRDEIERLLSRRPPDALADEVAGTIATLARDPPGV